MAHSITGLAGIKTSRTTTPRDVLMSDVGAVYRPSNLIIDGSKARDPLNTGDVDVLRAGMVLSLDVGTDKYAPAIIGTNTGQYPGSGTSLSVSAATATELNRRYGGTGTTEFAIVGTVAVGTDEDVLPLMEFVSHSAINTTTGVITITALSNTYPTGSLIIAGEAVQLASSAQLTNSYLLIVSKWGTKVTDEDSNDIDVALVQPLEAGQIRTSQIINYPTTLVLKRWLQDELNDGRLGLSFDDTASA